VVADHRHVLVPETHAKPRPNVLRQYGPIACTALFTPAHSRPYAWTVMCTAEAPAASKKRMLFCDVLAHRGTNAPIFKIHATSERYQRYRISLFKVRVNAARKPDRVSGQCGTRLLNGVSVSFAVALRGERRPPSVQCVRLRSVTINDLQRDER